MPTTNWGNCTKDQVTEGDTKNTGESVSKGTSSRAGVMIVT